MEGIIIMGGSSGGGVSSSDLQKLMERAKQKLKEVSGGSRHIFISFAYEDVDEVNLLRGQAKNENTDLQFDDYSVKEAFDSNNADYIKRQIREKIDKASVTLIYLSNSSAKSKWVNWEIEESIKRGKGVVGVFKGDTPPKSLPTAVKDNTIKVVKWSHSNLMQAIEEANNKK